MAYATDNIPQDIFTDLIIVMNSPSVTLTKLYIDDGMYVIEYDMVINGSPESKELSIPLIEIPDEDE